MSPSFRGFPATFSRSEYSAICASLHSTTSRYKQSRLRRFADATTKIHKRGTHRNGQSECLRGKRLRTIPLQSRPRNPFKSVHILFRVSFDVSELRREKARPRQNMIQSCYFITAARYAEPVSQGRRRDKRVVEKDKRFVKRGNITAFGIKTKNIFRV